MKQHSVLDTTRLLTSVVVALCLLIGGTAHAQPAKARGATCAHHNLTLSAWTIPLSRPSSGWWPVAVSGERVVMVHERTYQPGGPEPITMALAVAGSPQFRPIKPGAYPRFGVLQRWQLSWPWLVGVVDEQALPGPADWKLWAGNVQSGQHVVLDRGNNAPGGPSASMRAFPDFDAAGGRVVWTQTSYSLRAGGPGTEHIALYDLASHRSTMFGIPEPGSRETYANATISGSRVVWERYTTFACTHQRCPNHLIDLQLYDLARHRLATLTQSSFRRGSSFEPGLWGNDLVFLHGYDASAGGQIILVDLSRRVSGHHAFWWQSYRYRAFSNSSVIELVVRDGLVAWDGGMADLVGGGSTGLPIGANQLSGGHALVLQRSPQAPFVLQQVLHRCSRPTPLDQSRGVPTPYDTVAPGHRRP